MQKSFQKWSLAGWLIAFTTSCLAQLQPGSIDESFDPGPVLSSAVWIDYPVSGMALQPDGKILFGGSFTNISGHAVQGMVRLLPNSSVDQTFEFAGVGPGDASISRIILAPDDKILVSGNFSTVGGQSRSRNARLNIDGSLDTSFDPRTPSGGVDELLTVQSDGKVLLAHTDQIGSRVLRLNSDGTVDLGFESNVIGDRVAEAWVQDDAKILVGGLFTLVDGQFEKGLIRLNSNGTADHSFHAQLQSDSGFPPMIRALAVQSDGKLMVGGGYYSRFGPAHSLIMRLEAEGTIDATFEGGDLFGSLTTVTDLVLQRDGKIVVAGEFDTDGLAGRPNRQVLVKRLNPDGSMDNSFLGGSGVNVEALDIPSVSRMLTQPDGKLLILGRFYSVNGIQRRGVARLQGASVPTLDYFQRTGDQLTFSFLALAAWDYRVEYRVDLGGEWTQLQTVAGNDSVKSVSDATQAQARQRFYRLSVEAKPQ
jgi:uncharacterized delta-60 repeat protein